jgi:hypothetical protein
MSLDDFDCGNNVHPLAHEVKLTDSVLIVLQGLPL